MLSVITVPSGGWTLKVYVSVSTTLDTAVTCTIAAGDYFISWDGQSDDLLYEIESKLSTAMSAGPGNFYQRVHLGIDSDHKVYFWFWSATYKTSPYHDVRIAWTEDDGATIASALGFDGSADDTSTGTNFPKLTADYPHPYGWYADSDGLLAGDSPKDWDEVTSLQSIGPAGHAVTQFIGARRRNEIELQNLPNTKTWSANTGYETAPVHPYNYNEPLECWWQEARQGKRFRFYRNGNIDTNRPVEQGTATAGAAGTLTDSGKSWETSPAQRYAGYILRGEMATTPAGADAAYMHKIISSHTATVLTLSSDLTGGYTYDTDSYWILDHTYETYVLDVSKMREFRPQEIPSIDEYNIKIPVVRYET